MSQRESSVPWSAGGFRGSVRGDWQDVFRDDDPINWIAQHQVETVRHRRTTSVYRCESPHGNVYAKILTGLNNAPTSRLCDTLKWLARPSRSIAAMRVTEAMQASGIACAPIVLAARKQTLLRATEVQVSVEVPGAGVMTLLRSDLPDTEKLDLVRASARALAQLHAGRFVHGDMHANNMIPTGNPATVWFIDNDRTRRLLQPVPWRLRIRNLSHIGFRMVRTSPALFDGFLDEYSACAGVVKTANVRARVHAKVGSYLARRAKQKAKSALPPPPPPKCLCRFLMAALGKPILETRRILLRELEHDIYVITPDRWRS